MNGWRRPVIDGPTYREVSERLRLKEQIEANRRVLVTAWRAKHRWATCGDATALILAELERDFSGGRHGK